MKVTTLAPYGVHPVSCVMCRVQRHSRDASSDVSDARDSSRGQDALDEIALVSTGIRALPRLRWCSNEPLDGVVKIQKKFSMLPEASNAVRGQYTKWFTNPRCSEWHMP